MTRLTPDETRQHIRYKMSGGELAEPTGTRMLEIHNEQPDLDYLQLFRKAMHQEMPDVVFHASALTNASRIAMFGLLAADPSDGKYALLVPRSQPTGVYVSSEPDLQGVWVAEPVWGIWAVAGAQALPHRQDPLNPPHFVITQDVPRELITFCGTASRDPRHHNLDITAVMST